MSYYVIALHSYSHFISNILLTAGDMVDIAKLWQEGISALKPEGLKPVRLEALKLRSSHARELPFPIMIQR
jgi:hypothetical protein